MKNKLVLLCCLSTALLAGGAGAAPKPRQVAAISTDDSRAGTASPWSSLDPKRLKLRSAAALVMQPSGKVVYAKNTENPLPIASITKLMTAMVILDGSLDLNQVITITKDDRDLERLTGSRLKYGARLSREKLLRLALMASENRAASALARTWPGGKKAFVKAMNRKAKTLGMTESHFVGPTGLDAGNMASARDVAKMVLAARRYPLIHSATTTRSMSVRPYKRRGELRFANTNRLLRNGHWDIELSKTGYINEAGRCLVMQAEIADRQLVIVLLNSFGKLTPFGDSNRIRKWIERDAES